VKRYLVFGIAWLALTAAVLAARSGYPPAPEFSMKDIDGKAISLADMKGKVVFLNFWATWCPPCREEIPDFVAFYNQNRSRGVEIVGLSVDRLSPDELRSFVQKNKMSYPVVLATKQIINAYEPGPYIPTTIVIDKQGRIRDKQVGGLNKETLTDWFQKLSAEK
jgi:cytochrome c biogenesis protein CcmG/thiol:disulfide interchange protein DsbE